MEAREELLEETAANNEGMPKQKVAKVGKHGLRGNIRQNLTQRTQSSQRRKERFLASLGMTVFWLRVKVQGED